MDAGCDAHGEDAERADADDALIRAMSPAVRTTNTVSPPLIFAMA